MRRGFVCYAGVATVIAIFASLLNIQTANAAVGVPKTLSHQGRLLDASGNLLGGTGTEYCFKFALYDDSVVGAPDVKLWPTGAPSTMTATVKNGVYNVGIGDVAAGGDTLDFDFNSNDSVFLNIEVATKVGSTCAPGDGAEVFENLSPRQPIYSAGYAINSDTVDGFHAAQSATGNQIPALTSGNLILGATNPQIQTTGGNDLILQPGGALTLTGSAASTWGTTSGNLYFQVAGVGATGKVQIGSGLGSTTPDVLTLDVKSDAGDPSGSNGSLYYSNNTNKFRCYENGSWNDCLGTWFSLGGVNQMKDSTQQLQIGSIAPISGSKAEISIDDAINNGVANVLVLDHSTSGVAANGIGAGLLFRVENDAGTMTNTARITGELHDVTSGSESADLDFWIRSAGGPLVKTLELDPNGMYFTSAGSFYTEVGTLTIGGTGSNDVAIADAQWSVTAP